MNKFFSKWYEIFVSNQQGWSKSNLQQELFVIQRIAHIYLYDTAVILCVKIKATHFVAFVVYLACFKQAGGVYFLWKSSCFLLKENVFLPFLACFFILNPQTWHQVRCINCFDQQVTEVRFIWHDGSNSLLDTNISIQCTQTVQVWECLYKGESQIGSEATGRSASSQPVCIYWLLTG